MEEEEEDMLDLAVAVKDKYVRTHSLRSADILSRRFVLGVSTTSPVFSYSWCQMACALLRLGVCLHAALAVQLAVGVPVRNSAEARRDGCHVGGRVFRRAITPELVGWLVG
jgi:hypothetical protein